MKIFTITGFDKEEWFVGCTVYRETQITLLGFQE